MNLEPLTGFPFSSFNIAMTFFVFVSITSDVWHQAKRPSRLNVTQPWPPALSSTWPFGLGGIWVAAFFRQLKQRPLLPLHDPELEEALEHGRE